MRLAQIPPTAYARDVLPQTAALWAAGRTFDAYAAQTKEVALSGYGRKSFNTVALYDDAGNLVASCKRYRRTFHLGKQRLAALGIGAVFTPPQWRGRGYATAMLAMVLDEARAGGTDAAYLFSDIHPAFYATLGFVECPSRAISLRAESLSPSRITVANATATDQSGIRRCFESCERTRPWGFTRTPLVWEWIGLRIKHGSEHPAGSFVQLVVRKNKDVIAYVFGVRDARHDVFVLDEYGYADLEGRGRVPALIRGAAGDLQRIAGWLPPEGMRDLLPRGSVRRRKGAIMMIAPLTAAGKKLLGRATAPSAGDGVWATDHI